MTLESKAWGRWKGGQSPFPGERVEGVLQYLTRSLKVTPDRPPPAPAWQVPASRVDRSKFEDLAADLSDSTRLEHSFGMSYSDLLAIRRGSLPEVTDAVAFPRSTGEVEQVLSFARRADLAVVPWGGGTSVVGGVSPIAGTHRGTITVSLRKMERVLAVDASSRIARFECGILGPDLEHALAEKHLTLGHYPQSFESSTLGGWLSARSSGQASSLYGEAGARLRGATVVTPQGTVRWETTVEESTGPQLADLFLGSEGTLGIFTEATLEAFPEPADSAYRGILFPHWPDGLQALKELVQSSERPAVVRLSDPEETSLSIAGRPSRSTFERVLEKGYLKAKGVTLKGASLAIVGFEGDAGRVRDGERELARLVTNHEGVDVGPGVGESWRRDRFLVPALRDDLMDRGWMVETLETGGTWETLDSLHSGVLEALRSTAGELHLPLHASAHLSHAVPSGGCVYFTLIAPQSPTEFEEPLRSLKAAATKAILALGGSLSHHHGIGTMHRDWAAGAATPTKALLMKALKRTLDPTGMLNPSKLFPWRGEE